MGADCWQWESKRSTTTQIPFGNDNKEKIPFGNDDKRRTGLPPRELRGCSGL